jgi:hypothetical protein
MRIRHLAISIAAALLAGAVLPAFAEVAANAEKDSPISSNSSDTRDQRGRY